MRTASSRTGIKKITIMIMMMKDDGRRGGGRVIMHEPVSVDSSPLTVSSIAILI
jgi:hypothetical protein